MLYSTPLIDTSAANCGKPANPLVPNPLASNVVNMKVEYGIDSDLDAKGLVDTWVQATNGWEPGTLLDPATGTVVKINQIKAIRIGLIVQSEQFDRLRSASATTTGCCSTAPTSTRLFVRGGLRERSRRSASPAGNWRFRKYETIIPLRNEIWNKS